MGAHLAPPETAMWQDCTPSQMKRYIEQLRRRTPGERARQMGELCEAVRALGLVGLRRRHPGESDDELRVRQAKQIYGAAVIERLRARSAAAR
jgi:hypothetical protein